MLKLTALSSIDASLTYLNSRVCAQQFREKAPAYIHYTFFYTPVCLLSIPIYIIYQSNFVEEQESLTRARRGRRGQKSLTARV